MIRVEHLRKRFDGVTAVDDVSFTAEDGRVTGLLGPNGAGKTTTLRMLYALMRPDQGRIFVDEIDALAEPQKAQSHLGVLPDVSGLYPRLTARDSRRNHDVAELIRIARKSENVSLLIFPPVLAVECAHVRV